MINLLVTFISAFLIFTCLTAQRSLAYELVIPAMEYRTGPYASGGIPFWNGFIDYLTLLNERDGGIKGVKIKIARCETAYDNDRGVECYERLKATPPSGALIFNPVSTGIVYRLIEKVNQDHIPILSLGYGRASASYGKVFNWIFNPPSNYWSAASIMIKYIGDQERTPSGLQGLKIALVYLDNPYGREPIPTLTVLAQKHGFIFSRYPISPPGLDQKDVWRKIASDKPHWILFWGYGAMNPISFKEAAAIRFPMSHMIGSAWASSENDVRSVAAEVDGYLGTALHAPGAVSPVHEAVIKYVYDTGKAVDPDFKPRIGEVLYNRGLTAAMWATQAIAKAMEIHGKKEVTASEVRDGLEALDITEDMLEDLGFEGMLAPMKLSCSNHEGAGRAAIQQWEAVNNRWRLVSGFYEPDRAVVGPLIEADALAYAKEHNITPRSCK